MRDMQGYGKNPPTFAWPQKAKLAINFVINYEEGAELSPVNGDRFAETYGGEFPLSPRPEGMRNLSMESLFEYGSRVGIWRLLEIFDKNNVPLTFFVVGHALTLNPALTTYLTNSTHEVAGHGWRWLDYHSLSAEEENNHINQCLTTLQKLTTKTISGWYTGRRSIHTLDLLKKYPQLIYHSDSYADDLPYYTNQQLVLPYTLDCNDFRYTTSPGFSHGDAFYQHLKNTFDFLYQEKKPAMMTIGLHPRISGHPGRAYAILKFVGYLQNYHDVWIARRIDIANFWLKNYPA
ncbi:polysaccharide deacetylase (plasmid) [Legionella adelaidensis]|uniref:Polysaccharide deacetylase n=1 Tax=Legionella adelaidensis TaxID=45056 RepID=A0A0W0R625_9GAMM|nr:polysaccharide deacetylase family protein [Legionella adelaidensis]KTC66475.1 polysaccharide deacetylase [Legionella adelaidensis]VEH86237.1 polysaccharide deacetylase [Legionella adelaidensis]